MAVNLGAEKAISEIKELATTLKDLKSVVTSLSRNVTTLQSSLNGIGGVTSNLDQKFKNLTKSQKSAFTQVRNLKNANKELSDAYVKQGLALKKLQTQQKKARTGMAGLMRGITQLLAAFGLVQGAMIFANIVKDTFELIKTFDSLGFALDRIAGNAFDAGVSFRFMTELARNFGTEIVATTERWIKFLAAAKQSGLTLRETQGIFRSMTKAAAVLGLRTDELRGIYLALEQMLSKGKVTTEELRRQLGERLPGAMGIMAASMGITISQLDKMMKKGQILSAEVLPDFARAVEVAYGIETVEKVKTLVAQQNKMTSAWQLFVKNVIDDSTALIWVFEKIENVITNVTRMLSAKAFFTDIVIASKDQLESKAISSAGATADTELGMDIVATRKKMQELLILQGKTYDQKEKDRIQERYNTLYEMAKEHADLVLVIRKKKAFEEVEALQKSYDDGLEVHEQNMKDLEDMQKAQIGGSLLNATGIGAIAVSAGVFNIPTDAEIQVVKDAIADFANLTADLEIAKGLVERPDVKPTPIDESGMKTYMKKFKDLTNEEKIVRLKGSLLLNKVLLESEATGFEERIDLAKMNKGLLNDINDLQLKEKEEQALKIYQKQYDDLAKALKNEKVLVKDEAGIRAGMNKEFADSMSIAHNEHAQEITKIAQGTADELNAIQKDGLDKRIEISNDKFNKQIVEARKNYDNGTWTEDEFQTELTEIVRKQSIARYEIMKKELELKVLSGDYNKKETADLILQINAIDAAIAKLVGQAVEWGDLSGKEKFQMILETARAFAEEIGNLGNAAFDRRIENIEAEIKAETDKYDKLIALDKNNAANVEALEKQKADRLAILEKKRLKEQQKQAKFNKAMAITEIAINTAIAISKVLSQTGIFGLAAWIPIAALGALQTATVLAAPIPKYAQGLDNASKDHVAMINDGGVQEYVERDGKILTTKTKNAIVGLKKGDTVHTDYDSMMKKVLLVSALNNGNEMSEFDFNRLHDSITDSMEKGISKARIRNSIILNQNSNQGYKESLTRWN